MASRYHRGSLSESSWRNYWPSPRSRLTLLSGSDLEIHNKLKFAQTHHCWSCASEHKQPVLDINGVITLLREFPSWDLAQLSERASDSVYRSAIFQGLFIAFLLLTNQSIVSAWMLNAFLIVLQMMYIKVRCWPTIFVPEPSYQACQAILSY